MTAVFAGAYGYARDLWAAWNRFWFTPADPATLSFIRLLAGTLILYTHVVWTLDLDGFLGPNGYTPVELVRHIQAQSQIDPTAPGEAPTAMWSIWSLYFVVNSTWLLWTVHIVALAVFAMFAFGLFTRVTSVLAYVLAVSYAQRVTPGAFFGLDKVNVMLALYLMLGPSGARYSLDRLRRLRAGDRSDPEPSTTANIAIRLMQFHLCIMYLFSGLAKVEGDTWQLGTAVLWAGLNYEYQSISLTWLAGWPMLVSLLTYATVFWEIFYSCLVWNRFARPIVLWMAMAVHGGIALFMGMITFGLGMIFANFAFLAPSTVRRWVDPFTGRLAGLFVGAKKAKA